MQPSQQPSENRISPQLDPNETNEDEFLYESNIGEDEDDYEAFDFDDDAEADEFMHSSAESDHDMMSLDGQDEQPADNSVSVTNSNRHRSRRRTVQNVDHYKDIDEHVLSDVNNGIGSPLLGGILGFDNGTGVNNSSSARKIDYSCLSRTHIVDMQRKDVEQVADLCGLNWSAARTLLAHFRWNKERLLERYMEDSDRVLQASGLSLSQSSSENKSVDLIVSPAAVDFTCAICCDDLQENAELKVTSLASCKHQFCTACYSHYVVQKIRGEGECRNITCPASGCKNLLNEEAIRQLASMSGTKPNEVAKTLETFENLLLKVFVDDVDSLKWCPHPSCETIIKCDVLQSQLKRIVPTVKCFSCANVFCFGCLLDEHEPCPCGFVKMWNKKCQDDSETGNWLAANTKECLKCRYTIEKNGGCNHMTCKNCKYEFCWICMGPWSEHGTSYYQCNRFDENSSKAARDSQAKFRQNLERYLHYFNRHNNHKQSIKLANEFYQRTEKKMEEMQLTSEFSWIDVQFIKKALDVVNECRHTLMWTYAFAYYLKQNNMSVLFEDNQRDLEVAVEALNELIESPLPESDGMAEFKQTCLDKTEYCSRRRRVVLDDTARGLQEERWTYNSDL